MGQFTRKMHIRQLLAFNAYSEGWALYARRAQPPSCAYDGRWLLTGNRVSRLPARGRSTVKRWTREQGIHLRRRRLEVAGEVNGYAHGRDKRGYRRARLGIDRQRERAKSALGQRYDLKAFDDALI